MTQKTILITRPEPAASDLAVKLEDMGFQCVVEPLLNIEYLPFEWPAMDAYRGIIFTSAHALSALPPAPSEYILSLPVYVVGQKTFETAQKYGFQNIHDAYPDADALIAALENQFTKASAQKILYLSGDNITKEMALKNIGTDRIEIYKANAVKTLSANIIAGIESQNIDIILFFSARTAQIFCKLIAEKGLQTMLQSVVSINISAKVAKTIDKWPWKAILTAKNPTQDAVLECLSKLDEDEFSI